MNKLQIEKMRATLVRFAKSSNSQEATLLAAYNIAFNKSVTELGEDDFKALAYCANFIMSEVKGHRDAIAEFVTRSQFYTYYVELIRTKGFFFALFVKLMADIAKAKITV